MESYNNLEWLNNRLQESKTLLHDTEELQKIYPKSAGLKIMIDGWKNHIKELERKIEEEHASK